MNIGISVRDGNWMRARSRTRTIAVSWLRCQVTCSNLYESYIVYAAHSKIHIERCEASNIRSSHWLLTHVRVYSSWDEYLPSTHHMSTLTFNTIRHVSSLFLHTHTHQTHPFAATTRSKRIKIHVHSVIVFVWPEKKQTLMSETSSGWCCILVYVPFFCFCEAHAFGPTWAWAGSFIKLIIIVYIYEIYRTIWMDRLYRYIYRKTIVISNRLHTDSSASSHMWTDEMESKNKKRKTKNNKNQNLKHEFIRKTLYPHYFIITFIHSKLFQKRQNYTWRGFISRRIVFWFLFFIFGMTRVRDFTF